MERLMPKVNKMPAGEHGITIASMLLSICFLMTILQGNQLFEVGPRKLAGCGTKQERLVRFVTTDLCFEVTPFGKELPIQIKI